jgi:DedD protein
MGWSSFFKRKASEPTRSTAGVDAADPVQQARTRARQRLIGAAVLVLLGVICFPLIFETRPRPVPGNTPIDIAGRESTQVVPVPRPAAKVSTATPRSVVIQETAGEAGLSAETSAAASASANKPGREGLSEPAAERSSPDRSSEAAQRAAVVTATREAGGKPAPERSAQQAHRAPTEAEGRVSARTAEAGKEGKDAPKKPDAGQGRYIVQVGAFADAASARDARLRVEKLGLKTYTQVVQPKEGKRIRVRVGPFESKAQADKTVERIKKLDLSASVLEL